MFISDQGMANEHLASAEVVMEDAGSSGCH